jgi:hypothetical protein
MVVPVVASVAGVVFAVVAVAVVTVVLIVAVAESAVALKGDPGSGAFLLWYWEPDQWWRVGIVRISRVLCRFVIKVARIILAWSRRILIV